MFFLGLSGSATFEGVLRQLAKHSSGSQEACVMFCDFSCAGARFIFQEARNVPNGRECACVPLSAWQAGRYG